MKTFTLDFRRVTKWPMNCYDLRPSHFYTREVMYPTEKTPAVFVHRTSNVVLRNFKVNVDDSAKEWFDIPVLCYESSNLRLEGFEYTIRSKKY